MPDFPRVRASNRTELTRRAWRGDRGDHGVGGLVQDLHVVAGRRREHGHALVARLGLGSEHLLRAGPGHHGLQVLHLGAHAVVGAVRAGQAAAAPVGQVDGERVGQRECELGVAAGRLVAAVQQHHGRAMAGPQVADPGAVAGHETLTPGPIITRPLVPSINASRRADRANH